MAKEKVLNVHHFSKKYPYTKSEKVRLINFLINQPSEKEKNDVCFEDKTNNKDNHKVKIWQWQF